MNSGGFPRAFLRGISRWNSRGYFHLGKHYWNPFKTLSYVDIHFSPSTSQIKKEQKYCRNSAVRFSAEFPHKFWWQKSKKMCKNPAEIVQKNGQQNFSSFFYLGHCSTQLPPKYIICHFQFRKLKSFLQRCSWYWLKLNKFNKKLYFLKINIVIF